MVSIFIVIVFVHWLADFLLQLPKWKVGKSTSIMDLTNHVGAYSATMGLAVCIGFPILHYSMSMLWFMPITFVCHWITDYFTSKWNKKAWDDKKTNLFFNSIGFDQFLHYAQLFLTYSLLC